MEKDNDKILVGNIPIKEEKKKKNSKKNSSDTSIWIKIFVIVMVIAMFTSSAGYLIAYFISAIQNQ